MAFGKHICSLESHHLDAQLNKPLQSRWLNDVIKKFRSKPTKCVKPSHHVASCDHVEVSLLHNFYYSVNTRSDVLPNAQSNDASITYPLSNIFLTINHIVP